MEAGAVVLIDNALRVGAFVAVVSVVAACLVVEILLVLSAVDERDDPRRRLVLATASAAFPTFGATLCAVLIQLL